MPRVLTIAETGSGFARHFQTGECMVLSWVDRRLTALQPVSAQERPESASLPWIAPGLVDLQVNGYAGVDFQRDSHINAAALRTAVDALQNDGCGRFFLTLITDDWEILLNRLDAWKRVANSAPELRRAVAGWHVEGPFLSSEPGFVGAHPPEHIRPPSVEAIRRLRAVAGDDPLLLTLAPETEGAMEAIREAVALGMRISFGHSNASAIDLAVGFQAAGERAAFTHFGNALPQKIDRHDNLLWRVLDHGGFVCGVIPDSIHVSPELFRLIHRLQGRDKVWWTTDAMSAAGAGAGRFSFGGTEVVVGEDGVVRHPVTGGFAGSSLTPMEGIRRGARMLGVDWREVWNCFSETPARLAGLTWGLEIGADFVLLEDSVARRG